MSRRTNSCQHDWCMIGDTAIAAGRGMEDWLRGVQMMHFLLSPIAASLYNQPLPSLIVAAEGCFLGGIDIGDAFLQVEQEKPTVLKVDRKYHELGYTLPGQGRGTTAWFNKLQR